MRNVSFQSMSLALSEQDQISTETWELMVEIYRYSGNKRIAL